MDCHLWVWGKVYNKSLDQATEMKSIQPTDKNRKTKLCLWKVSGSANESW